MKTVVVDAHLNLIKKGRGKAFVERWTTQITKHEGWTTDDFKPFAIEEIVENGCFERRNRYYFNLESVNPVTNEVFASYEVARSEAWPVERCLMGCGWQRGFTRKLGEATNV